MKRSAVATLLILVAAAIAPACSDATGTQLLPVGSRCAHPSDCGTDPFVCQVNGYPGGYCSKPCITDGDCPMDALCVPGAGCRRTCPDDSACRTSEGYACVRSTLGHDYCDVPK